MLNPINLLIQWIILTLAFFIASKALKGMRIQGGVGTHMVIAAVFSILMVLLGSCLTWVIHIGTLGLLALVGLSALVKLVASTIVLLVTDKLSKRLTIDGFGTAFLAALIIAVCDFAANFALARVLG